MSDLAPAVGSLALTAVAGALIVAAGVRLVEALDQPRGSGHRLRHGAAAAGFSAAAAGFLACGSWVAGLA